MKITIIGTGYVGLTTGVCLSDAGHQVICADSDIDKINSLNNGVIPIYEYGLEDIINRNIKISRLFFTNDIKMAVEKSDVIYITVDTPQNEDGSANLRNVYGVVEYISGLLLKNKIVVLKSTVPVGTTNKIQNILKCCSVVYNPEFLRQGSALNDFMHPERIILGSNSVDAVNILKEIYGKFCKNIIVMDSKSAEITKYAANTLLSAKISFMNEIAQICEKSGANIEMVKEGISADSRIGKDFLSAGLGYGGSCFPKDVNALIYTASELGVSADILKAVNKRNKLQITLFLQKITDRFGTDLSGKTFAIWGLSYKPNTNDTRNAPSVAVINDLIEKGAKITVYDPRAVDNIKKIFGSKINYASNMYDALNYADALLLITEWNEFKNPDFGIIKSKLNHQVIFDGRNLYIKNNLNNSGFEYYCVGKAVNS